MERGWAACGGHDGGRLEMQRLSLYFAEFLKLDSMGGRSVYFADQV
jgi:hypothetical protein